MKHKLTALLSVFLPSVTTIIGVMVVGLINGTSVNNSASTATENPMKIRSERDEKVETLKKFFESYNSPLKENAETFIEVAEKYDMDFKLLPAISCMESTCGKRLIPNSYNPFGWGVYNGRYIAFESFDTAIERVGEGLHNNYLAKGLDTPYEIASVYTTRPQHWLAGVSFFMNKIEEIEAVQKQDWLKRNVLCEI